MCVHVHKMHVTFPCVYPEGMRRSVVAVMGGCWHGGFLETKLILDEDCQKSPATRKGKWGPVVNQRALWGAFFEKMSHAALFDVFFVTLLNGAQRAHKGLV